MTTIHVTASRDYAVLVQPGLLDDAGAQVARVLGTGRTAAIVAGATVAGLYAERLSASLTRAGFRTVTFTYPGGEHCKTLATYAALLDFLAAHRLSRSDVSARHPVRAGADDAAGRRGFLRRRQDGREPRERQKSGRLLLSAEPCALRPGHAAHPPAGGIPQWLRRGHQVCRAAQRDVF